MNSTKKFFIEIGSCDFETLLPLASRGWGGIIVEPIKYYLNRLEKLPGIIYENAAVTSYDGLVKIKHWDPEFIREHGKPWMHGVGNLNLHYNIFEANPSWKQHEIIEEVPALTLNTLVEKYKVDHIDFLKIDTESHEKVILASYDFRIRPTCIRIEYVHSGEKALRDILEAHGYLVYTEASDLYAYG